jgi:hypothetical protein
MRQQGSVGGRRNRRAFLNTWSVTAISGVTRELPAAPTILGSQTDLASKGSRWTTDELYRRQGTARRRQAVPAEVRPPSAASRLAKRGRGRHPTAGAVNTPPRPTPNGWTAPVSRSIRRRGWRWPVRWRCWACSGPWSGERGGGRQPASPPSIQAGWLADLRHPIERGRGRRPNSMTERCRLRRRLIHPAIEPGRPNRA